jgi:hypothetical protein
MNVDESGGLYFDADLNNEKINAAIEETIRRIQGLSNGTVAAGQTMDDAFAKTAEDIEQAFRDIDKMADINQSALRELESEYARLGEVAANAFMSGRDNEYHALTEKQNAIKGEITVRKELLKEIHQQADALAESERKMEAERKKIEENSNTQVSMRTRIRALREEMMLLIDQGIDEQSEAYKRLEAELGRLTDIQGDVAQQGRMLANDEAQFQGIITGLSGLAGGFSAVTGAVSLFAGENENLQKVMTRVQSVMAITMGMQQVAQTLNKDSAFQLVTINGLKEWWRKIVVQATVAETVETAVTAANTVAKQANTVATGESAASETIDTAAKGANTVAAGAGTAANLTLAGAFRAVGLAIKSIPVFGWIATGIAALVGVLAIFTSRTREAKKAQEEFSKAIVDGAYKPIGAIEQLSVKYKTFGNDLEAKKRFIDENKKAFDELSVAVNDVADAENLLVKNKKAFIDAQVAKAKATIYAQQTTEKIKKQMELEAEIATMSDTRSVRIAGEYNGNVNGYSEVKLKNTAKAKKEEELKALKEEINRGFGNAAAEEERGYAILKEAGITGQKEITKGTIAWYEQEISDRQDALKTLLPNSDDFKKIKAEIVNYQKELESITGKPKTDTSGQATKDLFLEKLEKQKNEYQRFMKWINSGDETIAKVANKEFEGLLKEGATYIDYLKRQRDIILSVDIANRTKEQNEQLRTLNDQIAEETKNTVLDAFNTELNEQLGNAKTTLEMLNIIAQRRKELANDSTGLGNGKKESLDDAEKGILKQVQDEYRQAKEEYNKYLNEKIDADIRYLEKRKELERQFAEESDPARKSVIQQQIDTIDLQEEMRDSIDYDTLITEYQSYQQKRQAISDDFDNKIALATENRNEELVKRLEEAKAKALSELNMEELSGSETWNQLFGNLDNLTTSEMIKLRNKIEAEWEKLDLSPEQLEALRGRIDEVTASIAQKNPFAVLIDNIKRYKDAEKDVSFKDIAKSAADSFKMIQEVFDSVVSGLETMGVAGDEETKKLLGDISKLVGSAGELAMGIATGNPIQIIQGSINVITSAFEVFNKKDRDASRAIRQHLQEVENLEKQYNNLERAVGKALGTDSYYLQKKQVELMETQKMQLQAAIDAEKGKKKTDNGKIKEWESQMAALDGKIEDTLQSITDDLLQTDIYTFAGELGDALISAFEAGEDAAKAFDDTVNSVMKNIIRNTFQKNVLEKALMPLVDQMTTAMGDYKLTEAELSEIKAISESSKANALSGFEEYKKLLNELGYGGSGVEDTAPNTSLTGAVKGVSEETASMVGGQLNAIRVNQNEMRANQIAATETLRQQLFHLANIDRNTGAIDANTKYIKNIYDKMTTVDSLRSQGLW